MEVGLVQSAQPLMLSGLYSSQLYHSQPRGPWASCLTSLILSGLLESSSIKSANHTHSTCPLWGI